ncbi:MAG: hypothetical protein ACRD2B_08465 [Terriglobia bacterium]
MSLLEQYATCTVILHPYVMHVNGELASLGQMHWQKPAQLHNIITLSDKQNFPMAVLPTDGLSGILGATHASVNEIG